MRSVVRPYSLHSARTVSLTRLQRPRLRLGTFCFIVQKNLLQILQLIGSTMRSMSLTLRSGSVVSVTTVLQYCPLISCSVPKHGLDSPAKRALTLPPTKSAHCCLLLMFST